MFAFTKNPSVVLMIFLPLLFPARAMVAQSAAPDPLVTRPATTVGPAAWSLGLSTAYSHDGVIQPLLSPRRGDILQAPLLRFVYGLGAHGQLEVEWPGFLDLDAATGPDADEPGDPTFWATVAFRQAALRGPRLGARFGFKVPSASDEEGLGTDEADVFGAFLLEQRFGNKDRAVAFLLNLGLGILGDPLRQGEQEDVITYGLALEIPLAHRWELLAEIAGSLDDPSRRETGDLGEGRLGVRVAAGPGTFDAALRAGITDNSPDWGLHLGYTWRSPGHR